jgi:serine-type D-Ala-D-Ala endopeptidase (penicillin-binding protein 7)
MTGGRLTTWLAIAGVMVLGAGAPAFSATTHNGHHRRHMATPLSADDPGLKSAAAYVIDQSDSSVWYSHNATVASPIASITKLMTALVVADAHQPLDEMLEVSSEDRAIGKGAASRLAVGTKLTRGDLLHLALMSSENRAAHALGRNYPGGVPAFVKAMNEKAKSLGMTSSHFVEPTGLSCENVASPQDLSRLVMAAAQNPTIRDFSTDTEHSVRVGRRMVEFRTTDALVRNPGWDIIVQKTGYITEAGRCLVMQAVIGGRNVVIVLLNSFGKYTRVADAVRMRKWIEARMNEHTTAHVVASTNS